MSRPALDVTKAWTSRQWKHDRQLFCAQFSPNGQFIAAGGQDKLVHVWDLKNDQKQSFDAHRTWVSALAFHPTGGQLFTADYHGVVHCWNYDLYNKPVWTIGHADANNVRAVVVTPDGKHLITAGDDTVIKVFDSTNGKSVTTVTGNVFSAWRFLPMAKTSSVVTSMARFASGAWATGPRCANSMPVCSTRGKTILSPTWEECAVSLSAATEPCWLPEV